MIFLFTATMCTSDDQNSVSKLEWREFISEEANLKVRVPCSPERTVKTFQEEPEPIRIYSFSCEGDGNKFLISFKNHMYEFNKEKVVEELEQFDEFLRQQHGNEIKTLKGETINKNGLPIRITEINFQNGNRIKRIFTKNELGSFDAMVGIFRKAGQRDNQFEAYFENVANPFIESFQVIERK